MKPFLKWVGGKTQILDKVMAKFPTVMASYHEPFLGGGSVLLELLARRAAGTITITGTVYASDVNSRLIHLYKTIQGDCEAFLEAARTIATEYGECPLNVKMTTTPTTLAEANTSAESYYYWTRQRFNDMTEAERNTTEAAALFIFLNKTCFRGVYRERRTGGFNVPFGHYKTHTFYDAAHIRAVSELIQDVVFTCQGFEESLAVVGPDDFTYMDPPYAPENATSFVGYTAGGFTAEQHTALFEAVKNLQRFLLSNADVTLVREALPPPTWQTEVILCRRAIHSRSPGATTNEVLISR